MLYIDCYRQNEGNVIAELPIGNYVFDGQIHRVTTLGLGHNVFTIREDQLDKIKTRVEKQVKWFFTNDDKEGKNPLSHTTMAAMYERYVASTGDKVTSSMDMFWSKTVMEAYMDDIVFVIKGDYPTGNQYFCPSRDLNNNYKDVLFHYDHEAHFCDLVAQILLEYGYKEVTTTYWNDLKDYEFNFKYQMGLRNIKTRSIHDAKIKVPNSSPQTVATIFKDVIPNFTSNAWTGRHYKTLSLPDAEQMFDDLKVKVRQAALFFVKSNAPISSLNPASIGQIMAQLDAVSKQLNQVESKVKTQGNYRSAKDHLSKLKEMLVKSVGDLNQ